MKTDAQLQQDVLAELRWQPNVNAADVDVLVHDGVVTLSGFVDSYAQRRVAECAAERVSGVRAIADELRVRLPGLHERDDTALAHAAAEALRWDIEVPEDRVRVMVQHGYVTLEGNVEWRFQREAAERAVRHLTGVRGVTNLVTVKPRASAVEVRRQIEAALARNAVLDAKRISVETFDGKVVLRGTVRSWAERGDAERAAWNAPGVSAVDDRLLVEV